MNWGSRNTVKMGNKILYIGDCPNPRDFERVQENLKKIVETEKEFYKWKSEQPLQLTKYYERSLN